MSSDLCRKWFAKHSLVALVCGAAGCAGAKQGPASPSSEPAVVPASGTAQVQRSHANPFVGIEVFVAPYSNADQARRRLATTDPTAAAQIAKIADTPQARWLGSWTQNVEVVAQNYVKAASKRNKLALIIAYNIPNRDCGQYSKGGAADPAAYLKWVTDLARGIGDSRAVVVLEPDALPQLDMCLSSADQAQRLELLSSALDILQAKAGVAVYLDAGHSAWVPAEVMADRLKRAGVEKARGFALNTSNYRPDAELVTYGEALVSKLGDTHFIVDSSRNGNGAASGDNWCNPAGRALGRRPTTETGNPHVDAFMWLKAPGESDGECGGGPAAGQWYPERALELARNAKW